MPNLNGGSKVVTLADAAPHILDADLLLFRGGPGFISNLIRTWGKGQHSHAAKAASLEGELMCLEVRELRGGRIVTLESQVRKYPRMIDVFRANAKELALMERAKASGLDIGPEYYNRAGAVNVMLKMANGEYGYRDILQSFFANLPGVRLFCRPNFDDEAIEKRPPYCSAACSIADRIGGGVDPVPHLADRSTEPSNLAHTDFYKYLFTLEP